MWQPGVHGDARISEANLNQYKDDGNGVDVSTHELEAPPDLDVTREIFCSWVVNGSFTCAGYMRQALGQPEGSTGGHLWDILRRTIATATEQERFCGY